MALYSIINKHYTFLIVTTDNVCSALVKIMNKRDNNTHCLTYYLFYSIQL